MANKGSCEVKLWFLQSEKCWDNFGAQLMIRNSERCCTLIPVVSGKEEEEEDEAADYLSSLVAVGKSKRSDSSLQ